MYFIYLDFVWPGSYLFHFHQNLFLRIRPAVRDLRCLSSKTEEPFWTSPTVDFLDGATIIDSKVALPLPYHCRGLHSDFHSKLPAKDKATAVVTGVFLPSVRWSRLEWTARPIGGMKNTHSASHAVDQTKPWRKCRLLKQVTIHKAWLDKPINIILIDSIHTLYDSQKLLVSLV